MKRVTRPMLGFTSFWSVQVLIAGIETMHMIRKDPLGGAKDCVSWPAKQFYSLAFCSEAGAATATKPARSQALTTLKLCFRCP